MIVLEEIDILLLFLICSKHEHSTTEARNTLMCIEKVKKLKKLSKNKLKIVS